MTTCAQCGGSACPCAAKTVRAMCDWLLERTPTPGFVVDVRSLVTEIEKRFGQTAARKSAMHPFRRGYSHPAATPVPRCQDCGHERGHPNHATPRREHRWEDPGTPCNTSERLCEVCDTVWDLDAPEGSIPACPGPAAPAAPPADEPTKMRTVRAFAEWWTREAFDAMPGEVMDIERAHRILGIALAALPDQDADAFASALELVGPDDSMAKFERDIVSAFKPSDFATPPTPAPDIESAGQCECKVCGARCCGGVTEHGRGCHVVFVDGGGSSFCDCK